MKTVTVNKLAEIQKGILAGTRGNVIGFDSVDDVVEIRIDEHVVLITSSENIFQ